MEADRPNTTPPDRKRRWYQFSLRSLLIGVTLLAIPCGYVGWQAKIVRERAELLTWLEKHRRPGSDTDFIFDYHRSRPFWSYRIDDLQLSWFRRLLGDHFVRKIWPAPEASEDDVNRIKAAFPESNSEPDPASTNY